MQSWIPLTERAFRVPGLFWGPETVMRFVLSWQFVFAAGGRWGWKSLDQPPPCFPVEGSVLVLKEEATGFARPLGCLDTNQMQLACLVACVCVFFFDLTNSRKQGDSGNAPRLNWVRLSQRRGKVDTGHKRRQTAASFKQRHWMVFFLHFDELHCNLKTKFLFYAKLYGADVKADVKIPFSLFVVEDHPVQHSLYFKAVIIFCCGFTIFNSPMQFW